MKASAVKRSKGFMEVSRRRSELCSAKEETIVWVDVRHGNAGPHVGTLQSLQLPVSWRLSAALELNKCAPCAHHLNQLVPGLGAGDECSALISRRDAFPYVVLFMLSSGLLMHYPRHTLTSIHISSLSFSMPV
jgi:hypothetical protein